MQISGLTYRTFASQNEFSYNLDISVNNSTGVSTFGFSGTKEYLELFTFTSGKILDLHKKHIWSYNPRESINISGNIGSGYLNYFINETPICLFSFNSGNYFNYFQIKSQNCIAESNFNIYGRQPNYTFIYPISGNNLGQDILAKIQNNETDINKSFQIFSGNFINQNFYSLDSFTTGFISGLQTGNLIFKYTSTISPDFIQSGIPTVTGILGLLILNTNFGDIITEYNFSITPPAFYFEEFLNTINEFTGIDNVYERNYQYKLNLKSSEDKNIYVKFSNLLGHNNDIVTGFIPGTGILTAYGISGFVYGEDYLSGITTGYLTSIKEDDNGNFITRPYTGITKNLQFATGVINYNYNVLITGEASTASFLKDFTFFQTDSDGDTVIGRDFFGKSIGINDSGNILVIGSTGSSNETIIGEGNIKIYIKSENDNRWILTQTLSPNQSEIFFKTGLSPTITGFLTGESITQNTNFSFNSQGINTINVIRGTKVINIFITGNYNAPLAAEWFESSNNNTFFNFNLYDSGNTLRTDSFDIGNGLYTGYLSDETEYIRITNPFNGSGAITGLIDISYIGSSLQGMHFGYAVELNEDGSTIVVGAPRYTLSNNLKDIGSAWIYNRNSNNDWDLTGTIIGEVKDQYLGQSLSLENNTLAIGSRSNSGVWIYKNNNNNYSRITGLVNDNLTGFRGFGHSLDLSKDGNLIVVGAPYYKESINSGTAWIYKNIGNDKWDLKQILKSNVLYSDKLFFPILGNHDYDANPGNPRLGNSFIEYFTILNKFINNTSNKSKYYDFKIGDSHFFILDSEPVSGGSSRDGNIQNGAGIGDGNPLTVSNYKYIKEQKNWFNKTISESNARHKFVFFHHPSFNTGGDYRGFPNLSPYKGWKIHLADAVFNGHEHLYERLLLNNQNPSYVNVIKTDNQLKISYKSNGILFATTQLRINISYNDFQIENLEPMSFDNNANEWFYTYNIPSETDYINFYFISANNNLDRNTLNNRDYDYIYYLYDSNDFTKTIYNIVGNGGINLRNIRNDVGQNNWSNVIGDNFYGFTRVDIYESGLRFKHYGVTNNTENFQIIDDYDLGDTLSQSLLSFVAMADWGSPNGGILTPPSDFKNPSNNYFVDKIAQEVRSQNINYIFGVGDLNYTFVDPLSRTNTSIPISIDENIGQFYFNYIPCYRGVYTGYKQINTDLLPNGLTSLTGECLLSKFGINNLTGENTTKEGFGQSVFINKTGNIICVGGNNNVGYLNNGSAWLYTGSASNNLWAINQNIINPEINSSGANFGFSINGNEDATLLSIGSPNIFNNSGSIYLYTGKNNYWGLKQKIIQPNRQNEILNFGYNTNINKDGSIIFIGTNNGEGSFYIYNSDIYTNLVSNQTGILTGFINTNQGTFTWTNISITGTGVPGSVFIDQITGYKQSTGILKFLDSNGSGLSYGDTISINNINFTYTETPISNFEFNSLNNFINILNSGAFSDNIILNNFVGVTGIKNNNIITLYSYSKSGIGGNNIKITRDAQNLEAIQIPNRYFQGGEDLRPVVSNWSGIFSGFFDVITKENTGFYFKENIDPQLSSGNLTGILWVDRFNKWIIESGITLQAENPSYDIFKNLSYNSNLQIYSGFTTINKSNNYLSPFTSLFINFKKQVYTNNGEIIFNNLVKYEISGENFNYTGILTG